MLEVIVATGIFILVAVALAGVWVMYGKALAKSGEVIAANNVARSVTEGLSANGWIWLKARENDTFPADLTPVTVERIVRGRKADITCARSALPIAGVCQSRASPISGNEHSASKWMIDFMGLLIS